MLLLFLIAFFWTGLFTVCTDDVSLSSLQTMVQMQAADIQALHAELTATKNDLSTTKNDLVSAKFRLSSAENRLQSMEGKDSQTVAFSVQFTSDPVRVGYHGTLKFDHFVTSVGGGYDPITGIFTAPVSGLYIFYLNIMSNTYEYFETNFVKEGVVIDEAHGGSSTAVNDQGSLLTVVSLTKGQRVWNAQTSDGSDSLRGGMWTVFSGFLLKSM